VETFLISTKSNMYLDSCKVTRYSGAVCWFLLSRNLLGVMARRIKPVTSWTLRNVDH